MKDHIVIKHVTRNLVDVFFGKEGFDPKEWSRFKREGKKWVPTFNKKPVVNWIELECGYVVKQSTVIDLIQEKLNELK